MSSADGKQSTGNTTKDKRPAPRGNAAYPRKRAVTACQVCRSRRTKCDNQRPACGFCARTGARCIYSVESDDWSTYDAASLRILERIDELEALLRDRPNLGLESTIAGHLHTNATFSAVANELEDRTWLLPTSPDVLLNSIDGLHQSSIRIAAHTSTNSHESVVTSPVAAADLDPSSSKQLLDNFFSYVHVKNPILQEDEVRRTVSRLCLYGVDWTTESCLALLICALGAIATPFGDSKNVVPGSSPYITSQSYFRAAQRRLGNCLTKSGVLEAQCLFLAGVYHMCIFKPFDAWRLFSQSLSCCQSLSFLQYRHTSASLVTSPTLPSENGDMYTAEQSVYWSAWKSEIELRDAWNMPDFPGAQAGTTYPPFFPTPPSLDRCFDGNQNGERAERESIGWYFYLSEISLKRIMSRLTDGILRCKAHSKQHLLDNLADSLPGREIEIETWLQGLPEPISLGTPPQMDDVCKFVLRGHLINAYEILYWPFLSHYILRPEGDQSNNLYEQGRERAALFEKYKHLAETALWWHVERLQKNKPGFLHRHHGTWLAILSCSRSAIMLIEAYRFNLSNRLGSHLIMPDGWREAVIDGVHLNSYWQGEAPDVQQRYSVLANMVEDLGIRLDRLS